MADRTQIIRGDGATVSFSGCSPLGGGVKP